MSNETVRKVKDKMENNHRNYKKTTLDKKETLVKTKQINTMESVHKELLIYLRNIICQCLLRLVITIQLD